MHLRKCLWGDCGLPRLQPAHLRDFALNLVARQMPTGSGFGSLPALEVEGLHGLDVIQDQPKPADANS